MSQIIGIENTTGEYIYFADPDDYVMPNAIEHLVSDIEAEEADLCVAAFKLEETLVL